MIVNKIQNVFENSDYLYPMEKIEQALDQMAERITHQLSQSNPLVLCVMIGALIPTAHLLMRLQFPLEVDYIHVTRYKEMTRGSDLHWIAQPRQIMKDRTILIVDIMDGGLTLSAIMDFCRRSGAKKIYTAVMVNKIRQREPGVHFEPDFVGLNIEDRYVFGFGLDYHEYLRNAPGIYAVKKEDE